MRIFVWGTGNMAEQFHSEKLFPDECIFGYIDTFSNKKDFHGKKVYRPQTLNDMEYDLILVAVNQVHSVRQTCIEYNVDLEKVIFLELCEWAASSEKFAVLKDVMPALYRRINKSRRYPLFVCENDYADPTSVFYGGAMDDEGNIYRHDYFRYRTFEFLTNLLQERNLPGDIAECGVFRGDFAALLNRKFPDKKLHLFDTFSGFDNKEAEKEMEAGNCDSGFVEYFRQTSEEQVMQRMLYKDKVKVYKGFFPETVKGTACEDTSFCFVSLDVDLEESTYQGIRFFYPRLVNEGYIMVHDFNSEHLTGVKRALSRYEEENHFFLKCVPIADHFGSSIITK